MARTIEQIAATIIAEKDNHPELAELNSPSQTAIWRLWVYVIAACVWVHESLWDLFREEIEARISQSVVGSLQWYREKALLFQYDNTQPYYLFFDAENRPGYAAINPSHRIIKYAATVEGFNSVVVVKVAKSDASGMPIPLSTAELTSFKDYMLAVKFAGTRLQCLSLPADKLIVDATVYYDPIAPLSIVSSRVENAINTYLRTLEFNGLVYIERIQDAIQKVEGVISVQMNTVEVDYGTGATTINRLHQSLAGYCIIHPAHPLSTSLTYIASNV